MGAIFRSAKNQVAMSLRFERDELGNKFVLPVTEEVGVVHETKVFLVGFGLGEMHPEKFRHELLAGLVGDKKQGVNQAFVVAGVEREGSDQAGLRGGHE